MVPYTDILDDIKHLEDVLVDEDREWSCVECRKDHERLLKELKELIMFRNLFKTHDDLRGLLDEHDDEMEKIYQAIQFVYTRKKWNGGHPNDL